ncbi:MAG: class I SAM-dependent methyltransferase [Acidimicrobiia bacterium]|nr:class I SAM-dependent methyltransferase [Acidimicrobiia bacterium]
MTIDDAARRLATQLSGRRVSADLSSKWVEPPPGQLDRWYRRLARFRREVMPWLDATRPLAGQKLLEVGVGRGASTVALAEQGASVVGIDVAADDLAIAGEMLAAVELDADLRCLNATELNGVTDGVDHVIFWAVLEHMTVDERIAALRAAWQALPPGGLLTTIETPNRLWPYDSHTAKLPYFSWLPAELAYRYSRRSPRAVFNEAYPEPAPPADKMLAFLRHGHGVSYHEYAVAFDVDHHDITVKSCMQLARRQAEPHRRAGWLLSHAGRTERLLRSYEPQTHRAWFQPFLYLTIERT